MDTLKGIGKALLIAAGLVVLPIILVVIGALLTIVGPVAGGIMIIGLPFISLGVIIGVKQKKKNEDKEG